MKTINLRDFYSTLYNHDAFYDVPDEVADLLITFKRHEESKQRLARKYKVYYSLDTTPGISARLLNATASAETLYLESLKNSTLSSALSRLTQKQALRLYLHYFWNMSYAEIARKERVNESTVRRSVQSALVRLQKTMEFI